MATSQMRRNPFGATDLVQSRMWDWFTTPTEHTPMSKLFGEVNAFVPPVDLYETQEEVILAASLPGLDVNKVDIQVLEDQLTFSGEQKSLLCFEPEENATQHMRGIPRFGRFSFTFNLPCPVEPEQSQAKYENGLLCVRFLKLQKAQPVRIRINSDSQQTVIPQNAQAGETQQISAEAEQAGRKSAPKQS